MSTTVPDVHDAWRVFRILAEFVEGFESLAGIGPAVSIFGSARMKQDDPFYAAARETAFLLAKEHFAIITGGGPGIMEAGNRGAFEAGGKSIGLNITLPKEQFSNAYINLGLDFHYFYARKVMFLKYASAFICFPGGYGTLDEFFETVTLIQTLKAEPFPVILYGTKHWTGLVEWMRSQLVPNFINAEDIDIFRLVDRPQDAVALVKESQVKRWWSPKDKDMSRQSEEAAGGTQSPMVAGAWSQKTGEGTVYGQRPKRTERKPPKPNNKH
jgi:uncharacterized protein (TIGR00730 family)